MASLFARNEHGWADASSTFLHPTSITANNTATTTALSSSLLQTRPPQRLSHEFNRAAATPAATNSASFHHATSPSSPSLDEIRARLQDVMRSIDDTLVDADATPPQLQLHAARTTTAALGAAAALPYASLTLPAESGEVDARREWPNQRPPTHPPVAPVEPATSTASSSGSAASSASWPGPHVVTSAARVTTSTARRTSPDGLPTTGLRSGQPFLTSREATLTPSASQPSLQNAYCVGRADASASAEPERQLRTPSAASPADAVAATWSATEEEMDGRSAAMDTVTDSSVTTNTRTGMSATYKAKLDFWRAGGHRGLQHASVKGTLNDAAAAPHIGLHAQASKSPQPAPSIASALSSQTTASKYMRPSPTTRHGALLNGGAGTRPSNTNTNTLTSSSVTTAQSSRSSSSSAASSSSHFSNHKGGAAAAEVVEESRNGEEVYARPPLPPSQMSAKSVVAQASTAAKDTLAERRAVLAAAAAATAGASSGGLNAAIRPSVHLPVNCAVSAADALEKTILQNSVSAGKNEDWASGDFHTAASLPHPSAVPSLSARLAVLRAADALQRTTLKQRGNFDAALPAGADVESERHVNAQAPSFVLRDGGQDNVSSAPHADPRAIAKSASIYQDPIAPAAAAEMATAGRFSGFHEIPSRHQQAVRHEAAVVDTPVRDAPSRETPVRRVPSPQPTNSSSTFHAGHTTYPAAAADIMTPHGMANRYIHTATEGQGGNNKNNISDVLVRSPDTSRAESPTSMERRTRRSARQDETSYLVQLAQQRQAAAEAAWREGQPRLRAAPPRPRSSSPLHASSYTIDGTSRRRGEEVAYSPVYGSVGRAEVITTAPLDALQAKLTPYRTEELHVMKSAAAGVEGEGELPMHEELAVRARLAARRSRSLSSQSKGLSGLSSDAALLTERSLARRQPLNSLHEATAEQQRQRNHYVRLSDARDADTAQHLTREVARQTEVQRAAQARVARAAANVPAGEEGEGEPHHAEELSAIRAHAQQLERLRRKMREGHAVVEQEARVVDPPAFDGISVQERGAIAARPTVVPDAASSTSSSLNIPEVSPSVHRSPVRDSPDARAAQRTLPFAVATRGPRPASGANKSCAADTAGSGRGVSPREEADRANLNESQQAGAPQGITTLSTAAALRATSVEVDAEDVQAQGSSPLSSVSATSVDDRAPTPERASSPKLQRAAPSRTAGITPRDESQRRQPPQQRSTRVDSHVTQSKVDAVPEKKEAAPMTERQPPSQVTSHPQRSEAATQADTRQQPEERNRAQPSSYHHHVQHGADGSGDDDGTASEHDWASSTQLPPSRPPRAAPPAPDTRLIEGARLDRVAAAMPNAQQQVPQRRDEATTTDGAAAAHTHVPPTVVPADLRSPLNATRGTPNSTSARRVTAVVEEEPPSPLPTKPSASAIPLRSYGQQRVADQRTRVMPASAGVATPPPAAASPLQNPLPIEDAERDIISSSPSAGRPAAHNQNTSYDSQNTLAAYEGDKKATVSSGSISPERLAALQSVRLHVSPVRGTAWQDVLNASAHRSGRRRHRQHQQHRRHRSHSSSSALSSTSSSDDSALSSLIDLSPMSSRSRRRRRDEERQQQKRNSQTQTRLSTAPPSDSPTRGPPSQTQPAAPEKDATPASATPPAALSADPAQAKVKASTTTTDPLLLHRRVVEQEAHARTAQRAQAMLCEHGVSVEVQLAGRRLPAVVKLSKDKSELLFYLERVTDTAPAAVVNTSSSPSSTPRTRSPVTPAASTLSPSASMVSFHQHQHQQQQQQQRGLPPSPSYPTMHQVQPSPSSQPLQQQQPPLSPRGSLYSVAPSIRVRGTADTTRAPPAAAPVKHKMMVKMPPGSAGVSPPPHGSLVKVPVGSVPPLMQAGPPMRVPAAHAPQQHPPHVSPGRFHTPPPMPSQLHPTLIPPPREPHSAAASQVGGEVHTNATSTISLRGATPRARAPPSQPVHVRELHHFPRRFARVYVPYGVVGYEADCGLGGPDTWEDVHGVLCGPAAYEVLRRYGCPLFAHMRGRDYAPYRAYVIIPEFQRIDVPQDAVLLVLDFKQRVDWVLFLLAMQLCRSEEGGEAARGDGATTRVKNGQRSVLSYGRALWMLTVQRLQRARALRGLNPFESRVVARRRDGGFVSGSSAETSPQRTPQQQQQQQRFLSSDPHQQPQQQPRRGLLPVSESNGRADANVPRHNDPVHIDQSTISKPFAAPSSRGQVASFSTSEKFPPPLQSSPLRFATPSSLLRSPRRGRVIETRPEAPPQPIMSSHNVSPRRVPSPATARSRPEDGAHPGRSNIKSSSHSAVFYPASVHVQSSEGAVGHHNNVTAPQPTSAPLRRGAAATPAPRPELLKKQQQQQQQPIASLSAGRSGKDYAPPVTVEEAAHPMYAEETSKPRFRWLKRVANSLNSSRRSSVTEKQQAVNDRE